MESIWEATHEITVDDRVIVVMERERVLYTRREWDSDDSADWEFGPDGTLLFQGAIRDGASFRKVSGYDECTECGTRFDATPRDKRPICPRCR